MHFAKMVSLNSLSVKVLLAYIGGAVLSVLLIGLGAVVIASSQGDILSKVDVGDTTRELAAELQFDSEGRPIGFDIDDEFDRQWIFESLKQEAGYRVMDSAGTVVLSSTPGDGFWPAGSATRPLQPGSFEFETDGVVMRAATESVAHDGKVWHLQFAVSTRFLHLIYRAFALPFTGIGIVVFSLVLLVVFGISALVTLKYTLKPLREISAAAAAISPRSLDARLQASAVPTEIAPLVESFNQVLERLEQGYRIQREFLSTAAHELKTPLALIRAQIELMDDVDDRRSLLNDTEHMSRQIQQLLLLAEASEAQNYVLAPVDVQTVTREAAQYLQRMANAAGVRLSTPDHPDGLYWVADRGALFTLLKNMLENAIQHAPRDTEVRVEVTDAEMSVRDWGPGVREEQLAQIFSRFWRGAHRRDHGAGLGLAICQEICVAHGWTLTAHRERAGLRLRVSRSGHA